MGGNKEVKGSKGKKDELGDTQKATCPGFLPTYLPHAANLIKSQQMPIEKLILSLLGAFFLPKSGFPPVPADTNNLFRHFKRQF